MIWKADIANVLQAYDPSATQEQIDNLYDTMYTQWSQLSDELADTELKAFRTNYGQEPDDGEIASIRQMGEQKAKDQIYGAYLEEMNQEIVQRQLEEEEWEEEQALEEALASPTAWKDPYVEMPYEGYWIKDLANKLWPDCTVPFYSLLLRYLNHLEYVGIGVPIEYGQNSEIWRTITRDVNQAVDEQMQNHKKKFDALMQLQQERDLTDSEQWQVDYHHEHLARWETMSEHPLYPENTQKG